MAERNGSDLTGAQALLEEQMSAHLQAARYERAAGLTGYRNGHTPRTLVTHFGTIALRVPKTAMAPFRPSSLRATLVARMPWSGR